MSSRKRPLTESHTSQTPSRYAPSTPHAIRALQQRSGTKTQTARRRRALSDTVRPDSARGILRQLARLTAPATKKLAPTPAPVKDKENQAPGEEDEDSEERYQKRPRLTLDIDKSFESIEAPELNGDEEEESELPVAPTPSILPDNDDDGEGSEPAKDNPTFILKSIDYAVDFPSPNLDRRASRRSFPASDPVIYHDEGDESTFLSERGRRAPTMEPTEVISHYDFGEINIDEADQRTQSRSPDKTQIDLGGIDNSYIPLDDAGGEIEALRNLQDLQRSSSLVPPDAGHVDIRSFDDSNFQLPEPDLEATSNQARFDPALNLVEASLLGLDPDEDENASEWEAVPEAEQESHSVEADEAEESAVSHAVPTAPSEATAQPRRKKVKMTRHGEIVPSLPSSLIKRVAIEAQARLGNRRPKLGKDHMKALEQATEWYFEQVGEDLAAYSDHARRKKRIDKSDVLLLLGRQRLLQGEGELLEAAKEFLPREVVAEMGLKGWSDA